MEERRSFSMIVDVRDLAHARLALLVDVSPVGEVLRDGLRFDGLLDVALQEVALFADDTEEGRP